MNFTEFWAAYPAKHKGSKANTEKLWDRLNMYEHHAIELSIPVYENHLGEHEWKQPMHAQTYLGPGRHWESFQPSESVQADIGRINERREGIRQRNAENEAYAEKQRLERYEKLKERFKAGGQGQA